MRQPVSTVDYPYIDKCTGFADGLQGAEALAALGRLECPTNGGFLHWVSFPQLRLLQIGIGGIIAVNSLSAEFHE